MPTGWTGINLMEQNSNTNLALVIGLPSPTCLAYFCMFGSIMFFARGPGVYVAILTLLVTLSSRPSLMNGPVKDGLLGSRISAATTGSDALRPRTPSLALGFGDSVMEFGGRSYPFFYLTMSLLLVTYLGLRLLVNSPSARS